jgi:L-rhamnose mutarotase
MRAGGSFFVPLGACVDSNAGLRLLHYFELNGGVALERKRKKFCWVWNIKPECIDEYCKMHGDPWPSIMKAHHAAGFRNYSIFRNGTQFIYEFELAPGVEPKDAFAYTDNDEACKKWNAITTTMIDRDNMNGKVGGSVDLIPEVFYLE